MQTDQQQSSTDFSRFVLDAIKSTTGTSSTLDQEVLRTALALSSSYLVTDTSTNPDPHAGSTTWFVGLNQLVDLLVALHAREELELETVNAASNGRPECWTVAGTWKEMEPCRESVRKVGAKLRGLLDEGGHTYGGQSGTISFVLRPQHKHRFQSVFSIGARSPPATSACCDREARLKDGLRMISFVLRPQPKHRFQSVFSIGARSAPRHVCLLRPSRFLDYRQTMYYLMNPTTELF
ncbi:hypothetical protein C8R44DRAFT_700591 [Mycena epipterygia]|nr:hypothetical protein C8R44DRAFT_700591 [Mycena epipterygia]